MSKNHSSVSSDRLCCHQAHRIRHLVMSPTSVAGRLPKLQVVGGTGVLPRGERDTLRYSDTHEKVMCYDVLPTQPLAVIEM